MTRAGLLLLALTAFFGCGEIDRTMAPADDALRAEIDHYDRPDAAHHLLLAPADEPGQRLLILGRLLRQDDGQPVAHHAFDVYQADHTGDYREAVAGVEASARLRGTVRTDSLGRFLISTVLPGDYGSTADNRHIHMAVAGARPDAYDFYFKQYINPGLASWARGTDQAVVLELKRAGGDTLVAATDLPVRGLPPAR